MPVQKVESIGIGRSRVRDSLGLNESNRRASQGGAYGTGIDYSDVSRPLQPIQLPEVKAPDFGVKLPDPLKIEKAKKISKTEQKEQATEQANNIAIQAAQAAEDLFLNDPSFAESSLDKKKQRINDYLTKSLPKFMASSPLYKDNAQLRSTTEREISARLNKILKDEEEAINKAEDDKGVLWDDFVEANIKANQSLTNAAKSWLTSTDNIRAYEKANSELQGMKELHDTYAKDLAYMRNPPAGRRGRYSDADIANMEVKIANQRDAITRKQAEVDALYPAYNADKLERREAREAQKLATEARETARYGDNAYYRELERSKREAMQKSIEEGEDPGLGIANNSHPIMQTARALVEQGPNVMAIGGAAMTPIPGAAEVVAGALTGADAMDGIYDRIMSMSREELEKTPNYKDVYDQFRKSGASDEEAFKLAQYNLATSAEKTAGAIAAPIGAGLAFANPATFVSSRAAIPSLMSRVSAPAIVRGTGEGLTGTVDEYLDEYSQKVAENIGANTALGTDNPITEGAHEAGKIGATIGALTSGVTSTTRGAVNTLGEKFDKRRTANPAPSASTQTTAQQTTENTEQPIETVVQQEAETAQSTAQPQSTNRVQKTVANYANSQNVNPSQAMAIVNSPAWNELNSIGDELRNGVATAETLSEEHLNRLGSAITELTGLGGAAQVDNWANNLQEATEGNVDLNIDDILSRYMQMETHVVKEAEAQVVPSATESTPQPARSANAPSLNELTMQLGDAIRNSDTAYIQSSPSRLFGKELTTIGTILEQIERNYGKDEAVFALARYADPELARASQHGIPIFANNKANREQTYDMLMENYRERRRGPAGVPRAQGRGLESYTQELNDAWNAYRSGETISMDESDRAIEDIGSILEEIEANYGRRAAVDALDRFANGKENVFGLNNYGTNILYKKLMDEYRRGNGTNTGTVQGSVNTTQQATAAQPATTSTAGQQNASRTRRSRQSASSPGFSWATHQSTGTIASSVPLNQTEIVGTGQGTDSRRDNSANDTAGAQSDLRSGSTAGTTEQRTVDGGSTETNGPAQPQNTLIRDVPQAGTREFNQTMLRGARQNVTDINVSPESEAKEAQVYERIISKNLNKQARNLGPRIQNNFANNKKALMDMGQDEATANLNAAIVTRVQTGMEQLTGEYFDITIHPYNPSEYEAEHGPADNPLPGTSIPAFTEGGKIYIADPNHLENVPHEVTHAMLNHLAKLAGIIKLRAAKGDTMAQQFIREFEDFVIGLRIGRRKADGSLVDNHGKPLDVMTEEFLSNMSVQERVAIGMEHYFKEGEFPNASGLNELYRPMAERIKAWFEGLMETLRTHVITFIKNFSRPWKQGNETEPDNHYTRRAVMVRQYAIPRLWTFSRDLPESSRTFLDHLFSGYSQNDAVNLAYGTNATAYTQGVIDATTAAITNEYIAMGIPAEDAIVMAQDRIREATRYAFATEAERGQFRTHNRLFRMNHELARQPELSDAVGTEHLTNPMTTLLMATDKDIIDMAADGSVDGNSTLYVTDSIDSAQQVDTNPAVVMNSILDAAEEQELATKYIDTLNQTISEGAIDEDTNIANSFWFESYFSQGGLVNEDGTPKMFYVNGNTISEKSRGYELETQSYARSVKPLRNFSEITGRTDLTIDQKKFLEKAYGKAAQDFQHNNDVELDRIERKAFIRAGYDSLLFEDSEGNKSYVVMDEFNIAENFSAGWDSGIDLMLDDVSISNADIQFNISVDPELEVKPNSTVENLLNINAELLSRLQEMNSDAVVVQKAKRGVDNSEMLHTAILPSQKYSTYGRAAHFIRKMITDDKTAIRQWVENIVGAAVGYAHSSPVMIAIDNCYNKVRGTRITLQKKILLPLNDWLTFTAKSLGGDISADTLGKDIGSIYRDLHIIESAAHQEQRLIQDITRALTIAEPNERAIAVDLAQRRLNAYQARQGGSTGKDAIDPATVGPNSSGQLFALEGGMTINEAMNELNELTDKYDDALIQEGINRIRQGITDMVNYNIERGVYSETDVSFFRENQYYMPLTTLEAFQQSDPTDVRMNFPGKMNYAREGAQTQAVDALSALQMLVSKSANAIGSTDVSTELVATYRLLEQRANAGDNSAKVAEQFIGNVRYGTKIKYINGMTVVRTSVLESIADGLAKTDRNAYDNFKSEYLDKAAYKTRTLETNPDTGMTEIVPYTVLFNTHELQTTDGGVMESHAPVQNALRSMFIHDEKSPNGFIRALAWTTSAYGATNTTYVPLFAPTNMLRDLPERLSYALRSTYRNEEGDAVNGAKVAMQATLNLSYAGEVMRAVFTGKPENIEGKVGQYLTEFEEQGILNTASVKAMLKNIGETNYAYLDEKIKALENNPDNALKQLAQNINDARKKGRAAFHLWAEMYYAIVPFAIYKALRDNGLTPDQASYAVTDMMNLSKRGTVTRFLSPVLPYLSSIGQTAAQISNFYGFNTTTFGHQRSMDKEFVTGVARAWSMNVIAFFVGSAAISALATMMGTDDDPEKGKRYFGNMDLIAFTSTPIPLFDDIFAKVQHGFGPLAQSMQLALARYQVENGYKKASDAAFEYADAFYRSISPVAGPQGGDFGKRMLLTVTPQIATPLMEYWLDSDYFGRQVRYDENIDPAQRASDAGGKFTSRAWSEGIFGVKNLYKWSNGLLDFTPEAWKHMVTEWTINPLKPYLAEATNDPLITDERYSTIKDKLGPHWSALGGNYMLGSILEKPVFQYKDAIRTYDNMIKDAGIYDLIKGKGGWDNTRRAKIIETMIDAGFDAQSAFDYAELQDLESEITTMSGKLKTELDGAVLRNAHSSEIRSMYDRYYYDVENAINNTLQKVSITNGDRNKNWLELPTDETIAAYRARRSQAATLTGAKELEEQED